jgi:hypothetical protein
MAAVTGDTAGNVIPQGLSAGAGPLSLAEMIKSMAEKVKCLAFAPFIFATIATARRACRPRSATSTSAKDRPQPKAG